MMKKLFIFGCLLSLFVACDPKDNYIDTGLSIRHDCSIYEYLKTSSYNWDSVRLMIQQANLVDLFDGKDARYPEITFFGITNHSIRRYMLEKDIQHVTDIPESTCRELLMKHLLDRRVMKENVLFGITKDNEVVGGTLVTCMGGNILMMYLEQDDYAGVENAGAIHLRLYSLANESKVPMATPDIDLTNGVVHALNSNYALGKI